KSGEIFLAGLFGRSCDGYFAVVSGCWRRGGGRVGLDLLAGRCCKRDDQHRPQKRSREMSMSHVCPDSFWADVSIRGESVQVCVMGTGEYARSAATVKNFVIKDYGKVMRWLEVVFTRLQD